ncbi:hypothetical protein BDY19DRAFT_347776 [Irpex rosettiformis]|uniref:Uncharacterized protein n=1 Tax=Irpex rosettiformis TaxID=378272 RepID=A0ACB8TWX5_9APHY|nr:hypothetical protein BDY19DRAFT_347776 [Irpex rosettiformis]
MLNQVSAVFNALASMSSLQELTTVELKDNPWVPPKDGRCIINELPAELLSYIFELGYIAEQEDLDSDDDEDEIDDNRSFDSLSHSSHSSANIERHLPIELLVTRVCPYWRHVALGLPTLWTKLEFKDPFGNFEQQRTYLKRAKGAPLDIMIDRTFEEDDDAEEHAVLQTDLGRTQSRVYGEIKTVMDIILLHAFQWRLLEVMVSHYLLMQLILESLGSLSDGVPLLEVLQLYHYEDSPEDTNVATFRPQYLKEQDFILFHNKAPKLSHVALWGVHLNWPETTFLTGLHDLELAYQTPDVRPSYRDFMRMLRESPQLITLTLCESGPAGGPVEWIASVTEDPLDTDEGLHPSASSSSISTSFNSPPPTMHTLSSLQNLVLAYIPPTYIIDLLDRLPMPALSSLALDIEEEHASFTDALITRFCSPQPYFPGSSTTNQSFFANIEALKMSGLRGVTDPLILQAGLQLSSVTQLNLDMDHIDWSWFDMLVDPQRLTPLANANGDPDSGEDDSGIAHSGISSSTVMCPRLTTFSIAGVDGSDLRELVQTRKERGHPIVEMYVNKDAFVDEEDFKWLKENVEMFDFFEGSEDEFDDEGSVLEVDLDDDDDDDEYEDEDEDDGHDWDDEDIEDEAEGDADEWTDED